MKKCMKRLLSLALAMTMAMSLMVSASAADDEISQNTEHEWTYEEMANLYHSLFPNEDLLSVEELAHSAQLIKERGADTDEECETYAIDDTPLKVEIATHYSQNDGLTTSVINNIVLIGNSANNEALEYKQKFGYNEDQYRHFTWNFRITLQYGENAARIYTINYEWASKFLQLYRDTYTNAVSASGNVVTAKTIAMAKVLQERNKDCNLLMGYSMAQFIQYMGNGVIQDFFNNNEGRIYAVSGDYGNGWLSAYRAARSSLCLDDSPTNAMITKVFRTPKLWNPTV